MLVQLLKKKVAALSNWQLPKSCPAVSLWNSRNLYTNTCRKKGIVIVLPRRIGPRSQEVCWLPNLSTSTQIPIRTFSRNPKMGFFSPYSFSFYFYPLFELFFFHTKVNCIAYFHASLEPKSIRVWIATHWWNIAGDVKKFSQLGPLCLFHLNYYYIVC